MGPLQYTPLITKSSLISLAQIRSGQPELYRETLSQEKIGRSENGEKKQQTRSQFRFDSHSNYYYNKDEQNLN